MPKTACIVTPLPILNWSDCNPELPQVWGSRYTSQPHFPPSRPHTHAFFELLFVEAGEGWHKMGERQVWAQTGDLFVITPGEMHDPSGLDCAAKWIVAFDADTLNLGQTQADLFLPPLRSLLYSQQVQTRHLHIASQELPRWLLQLQQLQRELSNRHLGFTEAARALLMLLLIDITRLIQVNQTVQPELELPTKCSVQSRPLLSQVFRFIEANYCQPIGLAEVAKAVNFSPAYLTDLVRRETGRTVLEWIVERRMAFARRLLLETDASVNQLVQSVGYLDPGHFIRLFRRLHGTTPGAWRSLHRR